MTEDEKKKLRAWAANWKETGEFLENLRREEIRRSNLFDSIKSFDGAFRSALWREPAGDYSGLIEFHEVLKKM